MHYAVLDADLRLQALDAADMESVLAFIAGLEAPIVAIAAPQAPNRGLMLHPEIRQRYNLQPGSKTWSKWRVGEYELMRRNIRHYNTPGEEEDAPGWVRNGFLIYRRLKEMGFQMLEPDEEAAPRSVFEIHPHACYCVMLNHRPFRKQALEGRMQRQLLLYLEGLDISNPMRALEEITRHHLLSGQLPLSNLYTPEELDALIGAYTAYLALSKPAEICQVGEREEGLITLPVAKLNDFYA